MSGEAEKTERAYVYMVRCAGGQLYTGWTNDPASRLHAHKSGKGAKCTRALGAQRFAYLERCTDKSAALRREAALKKLAKAQKEAMCAEWAEKNLPRLSLATRADAAEILDIYNWYVLHHTATFQVTPSSLPEYGLKENKDANFPLFQERSAGRRQSFPSASVMKGAR